MNINAIWQSVLEDDISAWQRLVHHFSGLVFTVALRSGLSVEDAEDCLQGTWLALYRTRRTIRDPQKLPGWLTKTARRQAYRIRQRGEQESTRREHADRPTETLLPDEELLKIERNAILQLAINQLDDRCRAIVLALFYAPEDKSYGDIAREIGLSINSLGPTRRRCLEKLREILSDFGYR